MQPLISIVVPAYNIAPYVEKCLNSILAQTWRNLEIIVVDDGSTDETGAILDRMAERDQRIRVIHQENGGVTGARLRGIEDAGGEWIGFVDGDDVIEPDMYERLLTNAEKYQADISHCGYRMVFPKGHVDYYYNSGRLEKQTRKESIRALIAGEIEPSLCCRIFRKKLFDQAELGRNLDRTIRINEDLLMNYCLFRYADAAVYEDVCLYHYLLRGNSAMVSVVNENKLRDPLRVAEILLQETEGEPELHEAAHKKYIRLLIRQATMACGEQKKLIRPYRNEARRLLRKELCRMLFSKAYGTKLKIMALCAGVFPGAYGFAHRLYAAMRGYDRKYSLDK